MQWATGLSPVARYNIGGLLPCEIGRATDQDFSRLRSALRERDLSALENENLIRLSQGFTFPRLCSDGISLAKADAILRRWVQCAKQQDAYEQIGQREVRQVGSWLGMLAHERETLEQRVFGKFGQRKMLA